jgi:hypothetical protein
MNINLIAHDTLEILCQKDNNIVITKQYGQKTYKVVYVPKTFEQVIDRLTKYNAEEIRSALEELKANGHIEVISNEFRATESGDLSLQKKFYINADNKDKADKSDNFLKRHWVFTMIFSGIIGALCDEGIRWLKSPTERKASYDISRPIGNIDSLQGHLDKNDSINGTKK